MGAPAATPTTIRFALDWTPNTNHTGLYVAQQQGWFRDAGLDVQILPYNSTSPDTLVSSGAAEFGISFQDSFTVSKAAGADITSVLAVLQHWGTEIGVRADRADIRSPRDLDGKTYGGFGAAYEVPKMQAVIRAAGGKGDFRTVVLGTSAYEALYAGQVDFTEPFVAWEGIEAQLRERAAEDVRLHRLRLPRRLQRDGHRQLAVAGRAPRPAAAFVGRAAAGLPARCGRPGQAVKLLMDANPGAFTEPELVTPQPGHAWPRATSRTRAGKVGTQTAATW